MTTSTRDKHNHGQHTLNRPWIPPLMCPEDVLKGLKNKGEKMDVIQSFAEAFWVGKGQGSGLDWVLRGLLHKSDSDSDPHWTLRGVDESRFLLQTAHLYPGGGYRWYGNGGRYPKNIDQNLFFVGVD